MIIIATSRIFISYPHPLLRKGFTLLEILLSLSIILVVLTSLFVSFSLGLDVFSIVNSKALIEANRILDILAKDLRSAYLPYPQHSSSNFIGSKRNLIFTTTVRLNSKESLNYDLQNVKYYLKYNPSTQAYNLIREFGPFNINKSKTIILSSHISDWELYYYDGKQWQESWSSSQRLPFAVRIYIELRDKNRNFLQSFSTIVEIYR